MMEVLGPVNVCHCVGHELEAGRDRDTGRTTAEKVYLAGG